MFILLILLTIGLGLAAQAAVKSAYHSHVETPMTHGLTGAQVARAILDKNGLHHVTVEAAPGDELSDHYDPKSRAVRLSERVLNEISVASTAISAHEVGHAIQHARGYTPLAVRSGLLPWALLGGQIWVIPVMLGLMMGAMGLFWVGIALFTGTVLFQLVTLPVEFDASRRARNELVSMGLAAPQELAGTRTVLRAAAMTYVVAALSSVAMLAYYVMLARR